MTNLKITVVSIVKTIGLSVIWLILLLFFQLDTLLTLNTKKEHLSVAYIHALATKASCAMEEVRVDIDSVDASIWAHGKLAIDSVLSSPKLDIQLKATKNWTVTDGEIKFTLKIKNYNDLRAKCLVPRILVVMCLPPTEDEWINHDANNLILKKCAYWMSLLGYPDIPNGTSIDVKIPEANLFSHTTLIDILTKISKEEWT